jgi:hypothetical protein
LKVLRGSLRKLEGLERNRYQIVRFEGSVESSLGARRTRRARREKDTRHEV